MSAHTILMATQLLSETTRTFLLPDLLTICPYPLRLNRRLNDVLPDEHKWLVEVGGFSGDKLEKAKATSTPLLGAVFYADADAARLTRTSSVANMHGNLPSPDLGDRRALCPNG